MAIIYLLEKLGIIVEGSLVFYILAGAFLFFFLFGIFLKKTRIYDKSMYVDAEIDPVKKEILEAARRINKNLYRASLNNDCKILPYIMPEKGDFT